MEHIEEAGVHSGDSACCLPTFTLKPHIIKSLKSQTIELAKELGVVGLMNVQYAVRKDEIFVLEVNPRASRTIPFVSKAIGTPLAKLAAKCMAGKTLKELGFTQDVTPSYFSVKEAVLPFVKFHGVDIVLGPEMKSTGEVMGVDEDFNLAYAKSQIAAGNALPVKGNIFISVKESDRKRAVHVAKTLAGLDFKLFATEGTSKYLKEHGIESSVLKKLHEGSPNVLDMMTKKEVQLVINTPSGVSPRVDEVKIRSFAVSKGIPHITTLSGAEVSATCIKTMIQKIFEVKPMQEFYQQKALKPS